MAVTAVSKAPMAVMITTGKVGSIFLIAFWTSMPDFPGNMRSSRTTSYQFSSIFLRPASPSTAVSAFNPSEVSSISMLSRISSSSSMMRTTPFRLDIHGFPNQWQFKSERRSEARLAVDRNRPAVFLDDPITDRQAQARAFSRRLCCKERVINLLDVFRTDAHSCVLDDDFNFRTHRFGHDPQLSTFRHRVPRVNKQVQKDLL